MSKRKIVFSIIILLIAVAGTVAVLVVFNGPVENTENDLGEEQAVVYSNTYPIVDSGQEKCFNNSTAIDCGGDEFPGQDGDFSNLVFDYESNNNGTVTDNNTGLVWQKSADLNGDKAIDIDDKKKQSDAVEYCSDLSLAGYDDWRLPDIKTLYSIMNFSGTDTVGSNDPKATPFIDRSVFDFAYGDISAGERQIDSQWATTSIYIGTVMNGRQAMFGLNLADGRIKGYPTDKLFYVKCVRSNENYGKNSLIDNRDETITDKATGLMWQKDDSGHEATWRESLNECSELSLAGYEDWHVPNAKELQSIVDYSRSPDKTDSAAIDPIFNTTAIINEAGEKDWGFYWTSTTHEKSDGGGDSANYVSFGRAMGYMTDNLGKNGSWMDVHGAGAQRSDPKDMTKIVVKKDNLDPNAYQEIEGSISHGPQGDAIRGENFYRCVRGSSSVYNP